MTQELELFSPEVGDEIDEGLQFATAALEDALKIEENLQAITGLDKAPTPDQERLLNVAVEALCAKYSIPNAALESNDEPEGGRDAGEAVGRVKRALDFLYAAIRRIVQLIAHKLQEHRGHARKYMDKAKTLIGRADNLSDKAMDSMITDRGLINALCINGIVPRSINVIFDDMVRKFESSKDYAGLDETIALINTARAGDEEGAGDKAEKLRTVLENGLKALLPEVSNPAGHWLFGESTRGHKHFASDAYFGEVFMYGEISEEIDKLGSFYHKVGIRRSPDVVLRAEALQPLNPQVIRLICRTVIRLTESVIRSSRVETLLNKAVREADFMIGKRPDKLSLHALKNFHSVTQNLYINHLRLTMSAAKNLLIYCERSAAIREEEHESHY